MSLRIFIRDLVQGIKNLFRWFPVIWKDRDWDHWFLEQLIIQKLHNMADAFDDPLRSCTESAPQKAKQMRLAAKLLLRCQDGYYESEIDAYYSRDFFIDEQGYLQFQEETEYDNLDQYFKKYPLVYKEILSKADQYYTERPKRYILAMHMASHNERRARRLAYKIMDTNSPGWWD